ncbi:ATP-binding protein [Fontivita pretiosa]|uniref:ATP-binding protein n=1 Tax=Fontivita pretiosa TaxID=2989684 RepID=UPI003D174BEE
MFKRWRQLHISLAAKCQILFGAAVILIISAALFVPWQRMEQLTEQLNEKAAAAVARTVVADHVTRQRAARAGLSPTTHPLYAQTEATDGEPPPSTQPTLIIDGQAVLPPRLVGVARLGDLQRITRFENAALARFIRNPRLAFYARFYDTSQGTDAGYRYAQPLYATAECIDCHAVSQPIASAASILPDDDAQFAAPSARSPPATSPTTSASHPPLLGLVSVDIPSQISTRQLLLNRVFILTAGLIAGVLAIIIFYLVTTRLILQPVRVLQETAEKVSAGDLNIRSDINTGDEFQVLSETFNTMLTNLKNSADQLRAVNKSLDLKLGQLAESNVALYESNRLKSEFLANVSHELRTPLNSILGFAELLKDLVKDPGAAGAQAKAMRYIQNILTAGHNLLDLINDLLDLAKIEAGRMEVRVEPLSLSDLFEALGSVLKPLTDAKGLTIVPTIAADVPIIQTDPAKLQQILYNFLSNAIKFSPANATIELDARLVSAEGNGQSSGSADAPSTTAAQRVQISVTDHGPGVPPDKHAVIFEKFRQIDGSVTREHSGTGLGLAISRELTGLLGGTIGLRSAPGQGATFYLILPLQIEPGAQDVRKRMVLT